MFPFLILDIGYGSLKYSNHVFRGDATLHLDEDETYIKAHVWGGPQMGAVLMAP